MEEGLTGKGPQGENCSTLADFHWKRSDNSFTFNFLSQAPPCLGYSLVEPKQADCSKAGSSFAFNFQIPVQTAQSGEPEDEAMQTETTETGETATELSAVASKSKVKNKKKKQQQQQKKKGGGGEEVVVDKQQKKINKVTEEAPKQENVEMSPDEQLNRELDWCIEQLELGLRTQKSSAKQKEEASRALKTLRSSKAPLVKKRQVMRAVSGDYRKKMEEEKNKQFKLIQSAMTTARVSAVSEPSRRPVFHRRAETKRDTTPSTDKPQDTHGRSHAVEQTDGHTEQFVFRPSQEEFCFNFDV
ncbi:UPF0488 protein C8orf33 homolog [Astyanax mexicanus]|uniref:RRP15-like protein n=2 Tax=Astyanax mexicanus TaxID=7994 RepID=A0A8B9LCJ7_ASTMX|nr:UPF0488 protein C8orf33 homolog [Astyanax mexicanus]